MGRCPICAEVQSLQEQAGDAVRVSCARCGQFTITRTAAVMWGNQTELPPQAGEEALRRMRRLVGNASGWIRDHPGVVIDSPRLDALGRIEPPGQDERATRLLKFLALRLGPGEYFHEIPGSPFAPSGPELAPEVLALAYSEEPKEIEYLVFDYLWRHKGFLAVHPQQAEYLAISPAGWDYLESLKQVNPDSQIGFCAMWFADPMRSLWDQAIEGAIRDSGYQPLVMFKYEHNNRIDDEIVALIRRSRFVVADFTGQRGGVYFEAGYASGLALPVIWTCREDDLENIHFDNRQYNFITWRHDQLPDFRHALRNRIEATLGRGRIQTPVDPAP